MFHLKYNLKKKVKIVNSGLITKIQMKTINKIDDELGFLHAINGKTLILREFFK